MSEDKRAEQVDAEDTTFRNSSKDAELEAADNGVEEKRRTGGLTNPVVFLLFMIFAMVLVLAVIGLKNNRPSSKEPVGSDDPTVALLKADIEARRMELNRQRLAMNLPPIEGSSEPVDDIARRLKRDAETLVALAESFRQMLSEKDSQLSERNGEILRLEKLRQDVSMENSRLQSELNRAFSESADSRILKSAVETLRSERDGLARELADARARLGEMADSVSGVEFSDLKRRFEETSRERDFYEDRVRELEAELEK